MPNELVKASLVSVPAAGASLSLPVLVERAVGAARFAWEEFFYAEHHNPHTQKAYMRAVKCFLAWAEGQGVELPAIRPGMIGQYLVGLGGSAAKKNLHLAALRGVFDRLVQRHVLYAESGGVGQGRQGNGGRGQDAGDHRRAGPALLASVKIAATERKAGRVRYC